MENSFHWADYVIFVVMLIASLGIGLYHAWKGQRKKTTEEYLMGGRELQVLLCAGTLPTEPLHVTTAGLGKGKQARRLVERICSNGHCSGPWFQAE